MSESFTFWFPSSWTMIGAVFTIFSFCLAFFSAFVKRDSLHPLLQSIRAVLAAGLRGVRRDVAALMTDSTARGQTLHEMLRTLRGLRTDFQALAVIARETREAVDRSTTHSQEPATPVLVEILAELRKMQGDPKIQRRLRPFSLQVYLEAQAEVLARERMQATPNPFHELD
ncbi:hypothetical protein BU24DRAFT_278662 [Aaosphaeria arxii CBS 175.79]|uniref:Uncharacterized protein n=1 Tax=Aaosphaeria arxii CBS 175.79 TaxID=1450172 RepID=A0A6A5XG28_9PLEO|nr:uncharacterized protein BU24DRAFT_278662 [Aaosphaeria arxii CBS 175.79]KAF2011324.1 hypothetical protein BU24DRAFT_278662 [Aaosphaeria arxii CBS 175.79]